AAARGIWDQLRSLREDPMEPLEMERVRQIFAAGWVRRFESMENQANHLAGWEALGGWKLGDAYYERFMSVTSDDVRAVAQRYLTPDRAGLVIYRPESMSPIAASAEEMQALLASEAVEPLEPLMKREHELVERVVSTPELQMVEGAVNVYRSVDGMDILVHPRPSAAIAHIAVHAIGGVREESAETSGFTTLAMRTTLKGTSTRTAAQIAEDAEMLGGSIGVSVGAEGFGWSISVPVQHVKAAVELLSDVIYNPAIPEAALETERALALAGLASLRDDMFRYPMRLVMSAAYGDHPYSRSPLGTEESLKNAGVEDIRQWYRARLLASPLVVGIVGDVVPEDAATIVAEFMGSAQSAKVDDMEAPGWPVSEVMRVEEREKAQTALAIAFQGPSRNDDRRFAAQLVATIASGLGGRFFDELRDRQSLAYTVHAYTSERQHAGMFLSYIATSPEKEAIARAGLLAEFQRLRDEPVTDQELARSQEYSVGSNAIRQESGGVVLGEMLDAWMYGSGLGEIAEYESRIRGVTREDILAIAREFFDPSTRVEGVVRGIGGRSV
ncbi:MAG: insulinase family protein, partial [Gemmatimonadaceae bacterium]